MSGGPEDKQEILAAILRTERLLVTTDAVTALAGATAHGQGIITIAGTGSIAFGRNAAGATARAGGWGYVFGDEGGAFDLVRQSLRAALRMEEGWGPPTSLRATLLQATGVRHRANHVLHLFYTDQWPRSRVATLAPLVDAAAARRRCGRARNRQPRSHRPGHAGRVGPAASCGNPAMPWRWPTSAASSKASRFASASACWWKWKPAAAAARRCTVPRKERFWRRIARPVSTPY